MEFLIIIPLVILACVIIDKRLSSNNIWDNYNRMTYLEAKIQLRSDISNSGLRTDHKVEFLRRLNNIGQFENDTDFVKFDNLANDFQLAKEWS